MEEFAREQGFQPSAFKTILKSARAKLLKARSKRIRPDLDHKILTSWNGMMIKALAEAYKVFGKKEYLEKAEFNTGFLMAEVMDEDGRLYHSLTRDKVTINGFLEDYAFLAEGLLALYEVTFNEIYIEKAKLLADYAIQHFYNQENGLFFMTSDLDPPLIARKYDIYDNVIPSSNSIIAGVLSILGLIFEEEYYREISLKMIIKMKEQFVKYPSTFANWGSIMIRMAYPFYTVVVTGDKFREQAIEMQKKYYPNAFFCGSAGESRLPVCENRFVEGKTVIYVCSGKECLMPAVSVEEAVNLLKTSVPSHDKC
jgi:hypothetical protein